MHALTARCLGWPGLGLASLLSPVKIRRDTAACIDCWECARACRAQLPVDKLIQIRSVECSACMVCVAACAAQDSLQPALPPRKGQRSETALVPPQGRTCGHDHPALLHFFGIVLYSRVTNHWRADLPREVYQYLVPRVNQLSHPGM
jgi:polyferredoxin